MKKNFKFSVIIPVYNVEEYLEETIVSIVNQTIGFEENIQMILVNDGSPDNSEEICLKYKELYPDNVVYYKQENSGVSVARNNGLKLAKGEYINFLDSDDMWEPETYKEALKIFSKNADVNSIIFPMKFFDAATKEHVLNRFYKGKKKVDIREDYQCLKMQSCSIIFRRKAIEGRKYSSDLVISEDARLVTEILLDNPIVAVGKSFYLYRKRKSETSAIQTSTKKKTWYLDTPKYCYNYLADLCKEKYGEVLNYVQFLIVYDIKWRLTTNPKMVLNNQEVEEYYDLLRYALNNVSDEIIANFPMMSNVEKFFLLNFKYGTSDMYKIVDDNIYVYDIPVCQRNNIPVVIDNILMEGDSMEIYGRMPKVKNVLEKVFLKDEKGSKINFEYYELDETTKTTRKIAPECSFDYYGIHAKFSLKGHKKIELYGSGGNEEYQIKLIFSYNSILNNKFNRLFIRNKNYFVRQKNKKFMVYKRNVFSSFFLELDCLLTLLSKKRFKSFAYRFLARFYRLFKHKKIWIVSDRIQVAGDNGQAFFEYMQSVKNNDIDVYFSIGKNALEYQYFKKKYKDKILEHKSLKHKILYLSADKIISSQADNYVYNLFGNGKNYIGDLYNFDFVYLQHGIIYNDLSPWLNVNSKRMSMFVTSSQEEYDSIVKKYKYNMPIEWIKLTGLPRYDKLLSKDVELKKQIVIMPTWRTSLTTNIDTTTGLRQYNPNFKKSEYFNFYNSLLNDKRLLKELKKTGYTIKFMPHPNMMSQIIDFEKNEYVTFNESQADYSKEFKENSLLITDYSSVFFDFSYLEKPIILTQFDRDTFYEGQLYNEGYLNFEKDGFGPVTHTVEETVDCIINSIKKYCQIDEKYRKRIKKFYKYHDKKNCERVYKEILKLDK